jgi:hypothetical protein
MEKTIKTVILTKVRIYNGELSIHALLDGFQPEFTPYLMRGWNDNYYYDQFPQDLFRPFLEVS